MLRPAMPPTCVGARQRRGFGRAGCWHRQRLVQGCVPVLLEALSCHEGVGQLLQGHVVDVRGERAERVLQAHQPAGVPCRGGSTFGLRPAPPHAHPWPPGGLLAGPWFCPDAPSHDPQDHNVRASAGGHHPAAPISSGPEARLGQAWGGTCERQPPAHSLTVRTRGLQEGRNPTPRTPQPHPGGPGLWASAQASLCLWEEAELCPPCWCALIPTPGTRNRTVSGDWVSEER